MKNKISVFKLIVICLTASFIFLLVTGILNIKEEFDDYRAYVCEEDTLSWALMDEDFGRLAEAAVYVDTTGKKVSDTVNNYLDIGRFYEAARLHHAYETDGNIAMAEQYNETMNTLAANDFIVPYIESIHNKLQAQP